MEDYRNLAMRTECEYTDELKERAKENVRALHAVLGMGGELGELRLAVDKGDEVNILEELGDFYWYLAILENLYNVDLIFLQEDISRDENDLIDDLEFYVAEFLDKLKRTIYYNKKAHIDDILENMDNIAITLDCLSYVFGSTPAQVKAANIKKLKARYGDKFSEENATNRDLAQESKILTENLSNE